MIFIFTKFGGIYCVRYILYLLETLIQHLWYSVGIKVETAKKKTKKKTQIIKNYKKTTNIFFNDKYTFFLNDG